MIVNNSSLLFTLFQIGDIPSGFYSYAFQLKLLGSATPRFLIKIGILLDMRDSVQSAWWGGECVAACPARPGFVLRRAGISPSSDEIREGLILIKITHRPGQVLRFQIQ